MQKYILLTIFCFLATSLTSQEISYQRKEILLGKNTIYLDVFEKVGEMITYVHVHENETTSLEAGKILLEEKGGKLITLVHSQDTLKNRNITFEHNNSWYQFDPNRIYTKNDSVLLSSIRVIKGKGQVTQKVIAMVRNLSNQIWAEVKDAPLIIALHNNKNEPAKLVPKYLFLSDIQPESFSIVSYIKKFDVESGSNKSCEDIYINPRKNNSEFFIVTEKRDFSMLYKKRYSVVLQNEDPVDDGSMSVFAKKNNIRYVNSEAKQGRLDEQLEMLRLFLE